jgi:hypothetical protein
MDDLLRKLTKDLGVSRDQARGGVVALLRAGQQNLSPTDFKAFLNDVPGADKLLKNAPPPSALSSLAGGWAGLAASFAELGVDSDTARKFGPIVIEHVRQHGGEDLVDKIRVALKI